jgi:hypothetical protein
MTASPESCQWLHQARGEHARTMPKDEERVEKRNT